MLFFCGMVFSGFRETIGAVYPDARYKECVIHMLRNSFRYVNYSDLRIFSSDFSLYIAPSETSALSELETIREKMGEEISLCISNWDNNWEDVSSFFPVFG